MDTSVFKKGRLQEDFLELCLVRDVSQAKLTCPMGCINTKKTLLRTPGLLFLFLCFLSFYLPLLLTGWLGRFRALTALNPPSSTNSSRNLTILLWHKPFGRSLRLKGDVCWDQYHIPHCQLVDQRSLFPSADVVVFHNNELQNKRNKLPLHLPRPQGQRWAWMSLEAPGSNGNLRQYANIFNMTVTYKRDADVTIPYGELLPKEGEDLLEVDVPVNKSSLVCWVVSNYRKQHKRSRVYSKLKDTVPVQVYGQWSKVPLSTLALLPTISHCYFYLAFENSISKDYITEKLWRNSYLGGAVPVVLGPSVGDYKAVAPPDSFIHIDEFESAEDLGKYLQRLAKDKKRYSEYFLWKRQWKVKLYTDWKERLCKICLKYNSLPQHRVYSDLQAWVSA